MHKGEGFSAKSLGKSLFHYKSVWSAMVQPASSDVLPWVFVSDLTSHKSKTTPWGQKKVAIVERWLLVVVWLKYSLLSVLEKCPSCREPWNYLITETHTPTHPSAGNLTSNLKLMLYILEQTLCSDVYSYFCRTDGSRKFPHTWWTWFQASFNSFLLAYSYVFCKSVSHFTQKIQSSSCLTQMAKISQ